MCHGAPLRSCAAAQSILSQHIFPIRVAKRLHPGQGQSTGAVPVAHSLSVLPKFKAARRVKMKRKSDRYDEWHKTCRYLFFL